MTTLLEKFIEFLFWNNLQHFHYIFMNVSDVVISSFKVDFNSGKGQKSMEAKPSE